MNLLQILILNFVRFTTLLRFFFSVPLKSQNKKLSLNSVIMRITGDTVDKLDKNASSLISLISLPSPLFFFTPWCHVTRPRPILTSLCNDSPCNRCTSCYAITIYTHRLHSQTTVDRRPFVSILSLYTLYFDIHSFYISSGK